MKHWQPYLIAIVVGLLVGIERERAHPNKKAMGVRTFLLISLLGAVAGDLQNLWLSILLTSFTLGLILISYFNQTSSNEPHVDRGLTTEFAAGIVFCLGYAAHQSPAMSAMIGPVVALILFSKNSLHRFTRSLKPSELEAALLLLLGGVAVINLVPDAVIDPWGIFNPRKFGYLVITLGTLEFSSYILAKVIGEKKGSLVIGFLGGLVSSTAILMSSARQVAKSPENWRSLLCSTFAATMASLFEILLIVGMISSPLLFKVALPIGAVLVFVGAVLFLLNQKMESRKSELTLKSPLDWRGVFRLSFILGGILALISVAKLWIGDNATYALSFLTGLFELHGVTLASATMFNHKQLSSDVANINIVLGVVASFISKIGISWAIGRGVFARALSMVFLIMIVIIILTSWLSIR